MNFNEWLNTLDLANLNDLPPNDGMEMGWYSCKDEVLKILNKKENSYWASCGSIYFYENIKEEIEKL